MPSHLKIKMRRKAIHISQSELVKRIQPWLPGITIEDISRIENGKRRVLADEIPIFAKALQCHPSDLLDDPPAR